MVQPQEDKNEAIMQRRVAQRKEGPPAEHEAPWPGAVVGRPEPPYEVVGLDALSPLLRHVEFPATKEEVAQRIGQARVPISRERTMSVGEILDKVNPTAFRSSMEVEDAVKHAWDDIAPHPDARGGRHRQRDDTGGRTVH